MVVRKLDYLYEFDGDSGGADQSILTSPFETARTDGKITAVRMRFRDNQSWTLTSIQMRLYIGNSLTGWQAIYDTGLLEHGEIPEGGTDPIDLSGSNDVAFWNDQLGEDAVHFAVHATQSLRIEVAHTATGGSGTDDVNVQLDYVDFC